MLTQGTSSGVYREEEGTRQRLIWLESQLIIYKEYDNFPEKIPTWETKVNIPKTTWQTYEIRKEARSLGEQHDSEAAIN